MLVPNPRRAVTRRNRLRDGNEDGDGCATGESSAKAGGAEAVFQRRVRGIRVGAGTRHWTERLVRSGVRWNGVIVRCLVVPDGSAVQTAGECMFAAARRKSSEADEESTFARDGRHYLWAAGRAGGDGPFPPRRIVRDDQIIAAQRPLLSFPRQRPRREGIGKRRSG